MQAARGASLRFSEPTSQPRRKARPQTSRPLVLFWSVAVFAWVVDQVSKYLAVEKLTGHPPVRVLGQLVQLDLTRNPGAAFSTGTGITWVFAVLGIVAAVVVVYVGFRVRTTLWALGLGLLLAGVLGNVTDRMLRAPGPFRGHVVDFVMLPHWPVFNVADVCINAAVVVIVVQALRGVRLDGSRSEPDQPDQT